MLEPAPMPHEREGEMGVHVDRLRNCRVGNRDAPVDDVEPRKAREVEEALEARGIGRHAALYLLGR